MKSCATWQDTVRITQHNCGDKSMLKDNKEIRQLNITLGSGLDHVAIKDALGTTG